MQSTIKKSDVDLKRDVLAELKYEPSVKVSNIGVLVDGGTVTLNGFVTTYGEKWRAVEAAKRVAGVHGIADDIQIKLDPSQHPTDGDIASLAFAQLAASQAIPPDSCQVTVREGFVTIQGEVAWHYQRSAVDNCMRNLRGVTGVSNFVVVKPQVKAEDVDSAIQAAFERHALLDANKIHAVTSGSTVVLSGTARNYTEREAAEWAAYSAPGVANVDNNIRVEW